jgi:GNAT superfamily N-acetyltransferase
MTRISRGLPGVAVRAAATADRDAILALQRQSLRVLGRSHYGERQIESYLRHAETLEPYLVADGTYFVADAGDRLAGCGGWSLRSPGYAAVTGAADDAGLARLPRLRAMYVHPDFARRGIGSLLVAGIERAILAAGFREAAVDATLPGVALYERCGYRATGEMHAELPDGETLRFVCMRKRLAPGAESRR